MVINRHEVGGRTLPIMTHAIPRDLVERIDKSVHGIFDAEWPITYLGFISKEFLLTFLERNTRFVAAFTFILEVYWAHFIRDYQSHRRLQLSLIDERTNLNHKDAFSYFTSLQKTLLREIFLGSCYFTQSVVYM